jgi:AraC family transcriptional regulator
MDETVLRAVERAIRTMNSNLGERLTIDDLARSAMFSKFHFTRVFQRVTGVSPGRFLSAMRLNEAKRLLVTTSITVADISHQVGYNSVGTFSSRFRYSVGVSPTTYRQLGGVTGLPVSVPAPSTTTMRGRVTASAQRPAGPIFVGLFSGRILEAPPATSTVLGDIGPYALTDVPPGTWYLLAYQAAHPPESGAFIGSKGPITIKPNVTAHIADIRLRPVTILDPPVLMAAPSMVATGTSAPAVRAAS